MVVMVVYVVCGGDSGSTGCACVCCVDGGVCVCGE